MTFLYTSWHRAWPLYMLGWLGLTNGSTADAIADTWQVVLATFAHSREISCARKANS
jgi:hypothetical protein